MMSQLTSKLENAYRVDLNHNGDYRFDLESEGREFDWVPVKNEASPQTPESDFTRSFIQANSSTTGNNAGYCATFRLHLG